VRVFVPHSAAHDFTFQAMKTFVATSKLNSELRKTALSVTNSILPVLQATCGVLMLSGLTPALYFASPETALTERALGVVILLSYSFAVGNTTFACYWVANRILHILENHQLNTQAQALAPSAPSSPVSGAGAKAGAPAATATAATASSPRSSLSMSPRASTSNESDVNGVIKQLKTFLFVLKAQVTPQPIVLFLFAVCTLHLFAAPFPSLHLLFSCCCVL
jgi:hypothetical protein